MASKVTANSPALVTSSGALAPGVRNCGSPTDLNCVQSYNMFANDPQHIGGDPAILSLLKGYPAPNDFQVGDGLNTAGYLWNTPSGVRGPRNLLRIDHTFNEKNNDLLPRHVGDGTADQRSVKRPPGDLPRLPPTRRRLSPRQELRLLLAYA